MISTKWLKRHKGVITFASAALALLGFAVKDGFREDAKRTNEAIDGALSQFKTRGQISDISEQLVQVEQEVLALKDSALGATHALIVHNYYQGRSMVGLLHMRAKILYALNEALPSPDAKDAKRLMHMMDYLPKAEKVLETDYQAYAVYQPVPGQKPSTENQSRMAEAVGKVQGQLVELDKATGNLDSIQQHVLNNVADAREQAARRSSRWTWASYALFGVGWFFGLIVQMPGAKSETE